nr:MAG TPA: hypothetical protein [Caudoviricetes sp.]
MPTTVKPFFRTRTQNIRSSRSCGTPNSSSLCA